MKPQRSSGHPHHNPPTHPRLEDSPTKGEHVRTPGGTNRHTHSPLCPPPPPNLQCHVCRCVPPCRPSVLCRSSWVGSSRELFWGSRRCSDAKHQLAAAGLCAQGQQQWGSRRRARPLSSRRLLFSRSLCRGAAAGGRVLRWQQDAPHTPHSSPRTAAGCSAPWHSPWHRHWAAAGCSTLGQHQVLCAWTAAWRGALCCSCVL